MSEHDSVLISTLQIVTINIGNDCDAVAVRKWHGMKHKMAVISLSIAQWDIK
jgi:hypothetical protein